MFMVLGGRAAGVMGSTFFRASRPEMPKDVVGVRDVDYV